MRSHQAGESGPYFWDLKVLLCATSLPHLQSEPVTQSRGGKVSACHLNHLLNHSFLSFFFLSHSCHPFPSPICFHSLLPPRSSSCSSPGMGWSWLGFLVMRWQLYCSCLLAWHQHVRLKGTGLPLAPATSDNQRPLLSRTEQLA